jgi:hypothetical protein
MGYKKKIHIYSYMFLIITFVSFIGVQVRVSPFYTSLLQHQQLWGYKAEEKLRLGIHEQKEVEYRWSNQSFHKWR